jgi:hypothetical protein
LATMPFASFSAAFIVHLLLRTMAIFHRMYGKAFLVEASQRRG